MARTIDFDDLLGPTYSLFSTKADVQRAINLYRAPIESGKGIGRYGFYKSPGLRQWAQPGGGNGRNRGSLELNDHLFQVIDQTLYDLDAAGTIVANYGPIINDGRPVQMAADPFTLVIISANTMYVVNGGALTMPALPFTPIGITFVKGYFVALANNLRQFYFSDDGITWDASLVQTAEADANNMLAITAHNQELWICGSRITQAFNVGSDPDRPFIPRDDAVMAAGILAPATLKAIGENLIWLERDHAGQGDFVLADGYYLSPISDASIANAIRGYGDVSDAVGLTFVINKQPFYRAIFPSANGGRGASWDYNLLMKEWSEVGYYDEALGLYERHRANTCVAAFGKILVGDHTNGKIYEMSPDFFDDDENVIRWERRAPHLIKQNRRVRYNSLEVIGEYGVGDGSNGDPDLGTVTPEHDPQMMIEWSDDGGKTFGPIFQRSMGEQGAFETRVIVNRLGTAIDRVFRISGTAKTKVAITGAVFEAEVLN